MAKHLPTVIWALRKDTAEYVRTVDEQHVQLVLLKRSEHADFHLSDGDVVIRMDRATARLLARRINQMLDVTRVRARDEEARRRDV